jgi:SNF family Na+-dependent transporter
MIPYFISLLLLGIPLMWVEWGIGRNGGRYRKGTSPGCSPPSGSTPRPSTWGWWGW